MDLMQLEYFCTVAKYENITKAAKELYISQSTLSQSMSRLEDTLGVELFDRYGGKLHLNDAGRIFLKHVSAAFSEISKGMYEVDLYRKDRQKWVYVASSVIDIFKEIIKDYHMICPDVHIDHYITYDRGIMEMLLNSKVDFAITPSPINDPNIRCIPLYEDEVFVVAGLNHPLACRTSVTLEELRQFPLVCNSCDSDIKYVESLFNTDFNHLNIIASSSETHVPRELTAEGWCLGFIPSRVAVKHLKDINHETGLCAIRIDPPIYRTTCISTKYTHNLTQHAVELYDYIVRFCERENRETKAIISQYYE